MIHFSHLRLPAGRYAILYRFEKRGEGLPLHAHGDDTAHTIVCTRGRVRVVMPGANDALAGNYMSTVLKAGERSALRPNGPHEIVALEDGASVLNEFVNEPPASYAALPPEALEGSADLVPLMYPLGDS